MWLAHPLVCCGLLTAGLVVCLYLFVTLKQDLRAAERRWAKKRDGMAAEIDRLAGDLENVTTRLREAEERAGILVPPQPPRSSLNLGKRTQVLRLFRRGEAPEQIAAMLALPQAEVELLLKVHRMALNVQGGAAETAVKAGTDTE